jgi:glycosyltransferase involved in cell wall biosynthesis
VTLLGNDVSPGVARYLWNDAERFDVIHAHSHLYFSTNLASLTRRFRGVPFAITNHGLYSQSAPEWLFNLYLRSIGRWTFNQADVVFCYTGEDRERIRKFGVDSRIDVISNGVDTDRFTPDGPTSELIDHEGPVVLYVGRLVEGKRPQDAIRGVSQLSDEIAVKLYVLGNGPMRDDLKEMADESFVEFLGHVAFDEMPAVYRSGDVLLLPSRAEGLPRTVLEAFASGVPVVSSYLEQRAPVVRKAGETVEVGDIEGYARALERVLDGTEDLGAAGRQTVVEDYRWGEAVEQTTAVLESPE